MKCTLLKEEDYTKGRWTGGDFKELAIFPADSDYVNRDFLWRLSLDTVEKEEAQFPKLEDYDRVIMVLEGETVLSYEGERVTRLQALEQDRFDGAWKTTGFGQIKAYNLIVNKGMEGYLDLLFPGKEKNIYKSNQDSDKQMSVHTLFCLDGYAVVSVGNESHMLKAGQQLVIEEENKDEICYGLMGEGTIIRGQIFYNSEESGPEIIPREKATLDDFKACIYLANVQFKWAGYMVKSLKEKWFDEELSKAIRKIEKFYLPTVVFFLGLVVLGCLEANEIIPSGMVLILAVCWILADCLLVSPAIYMLFVPKPVRKHIKNVNSLTPYEKKVRERELSSDPMMEKIKRKYMKRTSSVRKEDEDER